MKIKIWASFVCAMALVSYATSQTGKEVKVYAEGMTQMVGQGSKEVINKIAFVWKFGLLEQWEAANPSLENVLKNNFKKHRFSKREARDIFAPTGAYKVMLFRKPVGEAEASTETMMNMGLAGMHDKTIVQKFAYIRVVFRDGKLVHQRVW